ncbi:MAG: MogA/MoaB family molybdenum cofactor biosynthesis protein, partial [Polyangiaceae bacterium]
MAGGQVRVAAITVSDTRTEADDEGGARLRERLEAAGFVVSFRAIVPDEPEGLRALVARVVAEDLADAIVTTGGTGIAPRDRTYEAVEGLLDKKLDRFG